jgi:YidC/Oxa1 family membrane protein insertase
LEKRLPIALFLSFLVLLTWNLLAPRPESPPSTPGSEVGAPAADPRLQGYGAPASEDAGRVAAGSEERIELVLGEPGTPGAMELVFTNRGARLLSLRLADYFSSQDRARGELGDGEAEWVELLRSVETPAGPTGSLVWRADETTRALFTEPLEDALWQHRLLEDGRGIEFTYAPGTGLLLRKRLERGEGLQELRLVLEIENQGASGAAGLRQFVLTPAEVVPATGDSRFYQEPQTLAVWRRDDGGLDLEKAVSEPGGKDLVGSLPREADSRLAFAGVHNKFFALLVRPATEQQALGVLAAGYRRVQDLDWLAEHPEEDEGEAWRHVVCDLALQVPVPEVGGTSTTSFELYAGPKQRAALEAVDPAFGAMLDEDIGMFSGIAKIITAILGFYQAIVGNWGLAIILMTLTVRALLFPLNRRAQTAMARFSKKMKRVQPLIDEVKAKYESDPKRQREEQAKIMQREGAFPPVGGCLPLFLQFPIFIGLFQALRVHFDLRHEPFVLWMKDLSMPDQLARIDLDTHLPLIGTIEYLNILPLLMIVLWIVQHRVTPQPNSDDPKVAQQRKMMIGMQVFFALLFYDYASGLALYMITSSSVAIFEALVIKRMWPIDDSELAPKKPGRFMQRFKELQEQQQKLLAQQEEQRRRQQGGKGGKKGKRR